MSPSDVIPNNIMASERWVRARTLLSFNPEEWRAAADLGWARQRPNEVLYDAKNPDDMMDDDTPKAPSLGGGQALPGARCA